MSRQVFTYAPVYHADALPDSKREEVIELRTQDPDDMAVTVFRKIALALARDTIKLEDFFKATWPVIHQNQEYVESWHTGLILEYLTAVDLGQITRLVINIPPRSLKSTLVSVVWPTWSWTDKPWLKWIFSSYANSLAEKHSLDRRRVIQSDWYMERWADTTRLAADQNQKAIFQNTQGGFMLATSVGGSVTGKGGDRIVIDDIVNPEQAESAAERETAIRYYQQTLSTRLDNKKTGAIVAIEQRTHLLDLTGTVLKEGGWTHLKVPAESPARIVVKYPLSGKEVIREEGSVICEAREDKAILNKLKIVMGTRAYAAQMMQDPHAADSGYFHDAWWQYYAMLPVDDFIRYWSWDTAMEEGQENDFTVGILFAHGAHGTFIERVRRGRWQYPEAKRVIYEEWNARPANGLLIEDKVSGKSLCQDLARNSNLPVLPVKVAGDKIFRASLCSPYVESMRVFLPDAADWLADFKEELSIFPQGAHDDQVDAFSQGMNHYYIGAPRPLSAMAGQNIPFSIPKPEWL